MNDVEVSVSNVVCMENAGNAETVSTSCLFRLQLLSDSSVLTVGKEALMRETDTEDPEGAE